MKDVILGLGPACVNRSMYARKYSVPWTTAERWYEALLNEIPLESLESLKKVGHKALSKSLDLLEQLILNPATTPAMRLKAIDTLNRTIQTNTEFLEKFNMKPIVAQELNMAVNATLDVARIIKIAQESAKPRLGAPVIVETPKVEVKVIDILQNGCLSIEKPLQALEAKKEGE
jgi:hypothetical protein